MGDGWRLHENVGIRTIRSGIFPLSLRYHLEVCQDHVTKLYWGVQLVWLSYLPHRDTGRQFAQNAETTVARRMV